ncbi:hypothetical protein FB451DRAFT_1393718 [Mycena latifolia]|nr:hypothetical protein FB451DRAFT_1393718 [Mycena latifolia]
MVKHAVPAVLLLNLIYAVRAQTLFTVSAANPSFTTILEGTTFISAVGVGNDDWTTYTEWGTVSLWVIEGPATTETLITPSDPAQLVGAG